MFACLALVLALALGALAGDSDHQSLTDLKVLLVSLLDSGRVGEVLDRLSELERANNDSLALGPIDQTPSFYGIKGVALHNAMRLEESHDALEKAAEFNPKDGRAWLNLGEIRIQLFRLTLAIEAYRRAEELGEPSAASRVLRAQGWVDDWRDFERLAAEVERRGIECADDESRCTTDTTAGIEYTDAPGRVHRVLASKAPYARPNSVLLPSSALPPFSAVTPNPRRLRVGVVSSDFGVHPVSTLIRGAIQILSRPTAPVELFAFALHPDRSWWGLNVSNMLGPSHFISLNGARSTEEQAQRIAFHKIDVLIDLNGHTQNSGLLVMGHRPAPVQMSFLGWPLTTGAPFIDYFLSDGVAVPPEQSDQFTEALVLMQPCYIVSDYAQTQGDVVKFFSSSSSSSSSRAAQREALAAAVGPGTLLTASFSGPLLATFSNSQKLDPLIFAVWANILRAVPSALLLVVQHKGSDEAFPNLRRVASALGVDPRRIISLPQLAWIEHLYAKTAIDLVLDARVKAGHTTGLDAVWAGVPAVTLAGGPTSSSRAGESIAAALGTRGLTEACSLRQYEELALRLLRSPPLLRAVRDFVRERRVLSPLFNTQHWVAGFVSSLQATYEAAARAGPSIDEGKKRPSPPHIFSSSSPSSSSSSSSSHTALPPLPLTQVYTGSTGPFAVQESLVRRGEAAHDAADYDRLLAEGLEAAAAEAAAAAAKAAGAGQRFHSEMCDDAARDYDEITPHILSSPFLFLNVGGLKPTKEGWFCVNVQGGCEIKRPMHDLWGLSDRSVSAIYSSHTLEHASLGDGQVMATLREWFRVMKPGGLLLISVPDLPTLARLYLSPSLTAEHRMRVMRMMFGAQSDRYDHHHVGFDEALLLAAVAEAGFCNAERVGDFHLHDDTSNLRFLGVFISLNVAAHRCHSPAAVAGAEAGAEAGAGAGAEEAEEVHTIQHHADKWNASISDWSALLNDS